MAKTDKIMARTTPLDHIDGLCNVALIGNTGRDRSLQEVMMTLGSLQSKWMGGPSVEHQDESGHRVPGHRRRASTVD